MPTTPLSPDQLAEAQALVQAIQRAAQAELDELAATLVASNATHPFGATEFKIRDLAHKIAAKALEQHLAQKKTATKAPA